MYFVVSDEDFDDPTEIGKVADDMNGSEEALVDEMPVDNHHKFIKILAIQSFFQMPTWTVKWSGVPLKSKVWVKIGQ